MLTDVQVFSRGVSAGMKYARTVADAFDEMVELGTSIGRANPGQDFLDNADQSHEQILIESSGELRNLGLSTRVICIFVDAARAAFHQHIEHLLLVGPISSPSGSDSIS